jgi:hypothetical protein
MHYTDPNSGINVNITIKSRKILEDKANSASGSNSIPRTLIETSLLHIIVRVYTLEVYHTAVVSQEPLPGTTNRIKILAHIMNQRVFSILLTIRGVDAQPDTIDKGPYRPWFYLTEKYAAEQLTLFAINNPMHYTDPNSGINVNITIKSRKILEDKANSASGSNSIPRTLIETSLLHIIVRVYTLEVYLLIRLKFLAVAQAEELQFVKGNQQKNKVRDATSSEMVAVKSKSLIWHLYYTPKAGATLRGMKFPPYLLKVYTRFGFIDLKYIVRANSELMEGDKMIICEGPNGCKKYLFNTALDLRAPRCICNNTPCQMEKTNRAKDARKAATTLAKANNVSTLHAILCATTAAPCPRFKDVCSGNHNIEGALIVTPEGKRACTIQCKPPPSNIHKGFCRNGKSCAFAHSKYVPNTT